MFGIIDRATYEIRVFLFMIIDRQKETLLPIIKKNIYICCEIIHDNKDIDDIFADNWNLL